MDYILNSQVFNIIKNIIDIFCVAYLFYFIYKLFENTNTISIVKGFIFIIIIYTLANFIDLKTLAWIFRYVVGYFVILVVVLFQPEIRKVLSRIGQTGIAGIKEKVSIEAIHEIMKAIYLMAEQHIGGLIIIERNIGLKHLLEDAILIDAMVKPELIISIFYPGNILHDGAIIIQGDKIIATRVIVPTIKLDALVKPNNTLGTRHRAGIAVTIDTDAIALIVSEEAGVVSLAYNGHLEYNIKYDQLQRRIYEILKME